MRKYSCWNDFKRQEIYEFFGLFEEIALMMNSKFIRKEIVGYMFGFYVTSIIEVERIRDEIEIILLMDNKKIKAIEIKASQWQVFKKFVNQMIEINERIVAGKKLKLKFL